MCVCVCACVCGIERNNKLTHWLFQSGPDQIWGSWECFQKWLLSVLMWTMSLHPTVQGWNKISTRGGRSAGGCWIRQDICVDSCNKITPNEWADPNEGIEYKTECGKFLTEREKNTFTPSWPSFRCPVSHVRQWGAGRLTDLGFHAPSNRALRQYYDLCSLWSHWSLGFILRYALCFLLFSL